ncbi:MAG: DUF2399 domain-containing protein [Lachnospiraceae bacterium]|nr:DUF2399 domain-containing protein [Lachnospiraceae bacterium]
MKNKDYKRLVLEKLLKKYHNRVAKNIRTGRRILVKPQEFYKNYADNHADISEKEKLQEAVNTLVSLGAVTVDYLKFSDDVEKIYLCEDKIEIIYKYLRDEYGILPQSILSEGVEAAIRQYQSSGALVRQYAASVRSQAQDPRNQLDLQRIKANLKILDFLERNEESLYVRELSSLVYGDSKWFELHNYDEICNIIRETLPMPGEEAGRNDETLARLHVMPAEQEIMIKGDFKIEWDGYVLETGKLKGGIAISSKDIGNIRNIKVCAPELMTVENKTSYQRLDAARTTAAYLYLGGFASRSQIAFLRKVIAENPSLTYYHFGDIDVGGFLIHRHLCQATGKEFSLYCMGVGQLTDERFCHCLKELTDNDLGRMEALAGEEAYRETLAYMRSHRVKLEQEIVSYYLEVRQ